MHETSFQALDSTLLGHICDLNRELLELLAATARQPESPLRTPVVTALRDHWEKLPSEALRRLAECPYLLLELAPAEFQHLPRRAGICEPAAARLNHAALDSRSPLSDLTRRALLMAWHYAQTNPAAVRITLGLNSTECTNLAALPLPGLERHALESVVRYRLRWEGRVEIWRQLLDAAVQSEQRRLRQLQLRGLQLLAGRLLQPAAD